MESDIWKYTSFLLRAVYDLLPKANQYEDLGIDRRSSVHTRPEASQSGAYIVFFAQGRYTWRHNQVLRALAHTLDTEQKKDHRKSKRPRFLSFVRSGKQTTETNMQRRERINSMARDWELRDDIEKKLIFLTIVETTQRPDILLISKARRKWW